MPAKIMFVYGDVHMKLSEKLSANNSINKEKD